jgi:predicted transcriptional regulator
MKRIAMIMAIAEQEGDKHFDMVLTKKGLEQALAIITRIESWLPSAFEQMSMNTVGEDHARILSQIKKHGGAVDHSKLLRLNSNKLNARQFKEIVDTLRQAKLIEWDSKVRQYYITPEGWSK